MGTWPGIDEQIREQRRMNLRYNNQEWTAQQLAHFYQSLYGTATTAGANPVSYYPHQPAEPPLDINQLLIEEDF